MPASIPYRGSSGEKRAARIQKTWRRNRLISAQYTTTPRCESSSSCTYQSSWYATLADH
jgi:hypothetical protein